MPMHRNVSVVASVGSVVDNIRQQRQDSIKTLESNSAALSQWLAEAITVSAFSSEDPCSFLHQIVLTFF